ncbi:MAG: ATP phosphoribosyltransferase regulatory subunit [Gammaproteobacteria bacterium]|nr:MAG: ATP phosphoribosyltransferase regulatory subunit [Gammaproteobacteria bacterium]
MARAEQWLLPDGVEEILPEKAARIERLRRNLLDLYASWGYELVFPPMLEYMESLHTGVGSDLALQTFSITDQFSGRQMGLRADITPQVARIDAHGLNRDVPVRLCYAGTVLHAKPAALGASRSLIQIGAELYGHGGLESDIEIIRLMIESLRESSIEHIHLDLGHVGIYRSLVKLAELSDEQERELFDIYQRKAAAELDVFLEENIPDGNLRDKLLGLKTLSGGPEVLDQAQSMLGMLSDVSLAIADMKGIVEKLQSQYPDLELYIDCSELRGYHYHTGVVFAAYTPGVGRAIAKGGRYDHLGEKFGRARPATGFSADLKDLITLAETDSESLGGIFVPPSDEVSCEGEARKLRKQGHRVVMGLPGQEGGALAMDCTKELVFEAGSWTIKVVEA